MSLAMAYSIRKAAKNAKAPQKSESEVVESKPITLNRSGLAAKVMASRQAATVEPEQDEDFLLEDLIEPEVTLDEPSVDPLEARKAKIAAIMSRPR